LHEFVVDTANAIIRTAAEPSVRDVRSLPSDVRDVELLSGSTRP